MRPRKGRALVRHRRRQLPPKQRRWRWPRGRLRAPFWRVGRVFKTWTVFGNNADKKWKHMQTMGEAKVFLMDRTQICICHIAYCVGAYTIDLYFGAVHILFVYVFIVCFIFILIC